MKSPETNANQPGAGDPSGVSSSRPSPKASDYLGAPAVVAPARQPPVSPQTYPSPAWGRGAVEAEGAAGAPVPSRVVRAFEISLSLSGLGLFLFMIMHTSLLFSVLFGAQTMDSLAAFLERYYLVQIGVVFLIPLVLFHIFLSLRKVPTTFRQQQIIVQHMGALKHFDTWTWAVQMLTAVALMILISIHLWVVLTDIPIQAAKSGTRIFGVYAWFYEPFSILVWLHGGTGIFRILVKWGILGHRWAHIAVVAWVVLVLAVSYAIVETMRQIGARL